eukprot:m.308005 g.308005  ORF g.308005 m.308005 type:complete len:465 (+) comp43230_c0_seq1:243-1637(+)
MLAVVLFLLSGSLAVWAQTTPCDCTASPVSCVRDPPAEFDCPGGIVPNNKKCPCCWKCGQQEGESCDAGMPETGDSSQRTFRYCGEGLECIKDRVDEYGQDVGHCSGRRFCPFGPNHRKNCMNCTCDEDGREMCYRDDAEAAACPQNPPPCEDGTPRRYSIYTCCLACPADCPPGRRCEDLIEVKSKPESPVCVVEGDRLSFYVDIFGGFFNPILLHNGTRPKNKVSMTGQSIERDSSENTVTSYVRLTVAGNNAQMETHDGEYAIFVENARGLMFCLVKVTVEVKQREAKDCDFEKDTCQWKSTGQCGLAWKRKCGSTDTPGTGPSSGNNGSKYYAYVDSLTQASGCTTTLCSGCILPEQNVCGFSFAYHMYGEDMGTLRVRQIFEGEKHGKVIWKGVGDKSNKWHMAKRKLKTGVSKICFYPTMKGKKGSKVSTYKGDIAVDDLKFIKCPNPTTPIPTASDN